MEKRNDSSEEVSEILCVSLYDLNLEESYQRVDMLDTGEEFCDQIGQLIYTYTRQNADSDLDTKFISKTQHIIIRCARKVNKLLSDELKYYLQQILENVKQKPTATLPPHLRLGIIKNQKRIREIGLRQLWQIRNKKNPRVRQIQKCQTMISNTCPPLLPRLKVRAKMKLT
ncbi:hypothetical protein NPIL_650091 [Nephila pilipes]|uniref:Uncharacterized protein n=1 Tax=Nephila pilipes TaxID=299642 RepID=A0A8X6TQI1_NEPPI|nr:hypothetical protein NPIL_650091 [Nephila pilipes]